MNRNLILGNFCLGLTLISLIYVIQVKRNTLYTNQNWESSKLQLNKIPVGAAECYLHHRMLAGNHMDIGSWHGYQEYYYKDKVELSEITFRFKLPLGAYFDLLFATKSDSVKGLRIANNSEYSSMVFQSFERKFYKTKEYDHEQIGKNWNDLIVRFEENKFRLFLNGKLCLEEVYNSGSECRLGFRGSIQSTLIDNIHIRDMEGNTVVAESFSPRLPGKRTWLCFFLIILLFNILLIIFKKHGVRLAYIVFVCGFSLIVYCTYFIFYGQFQYPDKPWLIDRKEYPNIFLSEDEFSDLLFKKYNYPKESGEMKIMVIGGSQIFGEGSSLSEHEIVPVLEKMLNINPHVLKATCISLGVQGAESAYLFKKYQSEWIDLEPDIVVLNMSNNDPDGQYLKSNLIKFARLNREHNIKTILVKEANSPESNRLEDLLAKHAVMDEIGSEYNLRVVDMHELLGKQFNSGHLFWDHVHLTDYGQLLLAEHLDSILSEEICLELNN